MAEAVKVGTEFLVNTETADGQGNPTITGLTNGGFVVTWQDNSRTLGDNDATSIKAQLFSASGAKLGTEYESLIGTVRNVGYKAVRPARGRSPVPEADAGDDYDDADAYDQDPAGFIDGLNDPLRAK